MTSAGARSAPSRLGTIAISVCVALGMLLFAALIFARVFIVNNYAIRSASMLPTLQVGDLVLVSKVAYRDAAPRRGDVVIVNGPNGESWIKRVVGLPGDRIQLKDGVVWLNGRAIPRDKIDTTAALTGSPASVYREVLPDGRWFLTLDIGSTEIDNTREFRAPAGKFFVLGDNRDNSDDSRLSLGYVDATNITGKVIRRYYSVSHGPEFSPVE